MHVTSISLLFDFGFSKICQPFTSTSSVLSNKVARLNFNLFPMTVSEYLLFQDGFNSTPTKSNPHLLRHPCCQPSSSLPARHSVDRTLHPCQTWICNLYQLCLD